MSHQHLIRSLSYDSSYLPSSSDNPDKIIPLRACIGTYSRLLHIIQIERNQEDLPSKEDPNEQQEEGSKSQDDASNEPSSTADDASSSTPPVSSSRKDSITSNTSSTSVSSSESAKTRGSTPAPQSPSSAPPKFKVSLLGTVKPSVSKLSSPPPCLAYAAQEIFVSEHLTSLVTASESSGVSSSSVGDNSPISSASSSSMNPVKTTSIVRKIRFPNPSNSESGAQLEGETQVLQGAVVEIHVTKNFLVLSYAENKIQFLRRDNLKLVREVKTCNTLTSVCYSEDLVACLHASQPQGTISIHDLGMSISGDNNIVEGLNAETGKDVTHLKAHKQKVKRFSFNSDGTLLASTSKYATVVKVFQTMTREKVREMRRAYKTGVVYSFVFSPDSQVLASFSNTGLHLFSLGHDERITNTFSSLFALSYMGASIYGSEWAAIEDTRVGNVMGYAQFDARSMNTIHYLSFTGHHYSITIDRSKDKNAAPTIAKTELNPVMDSYRRSNSHSKNFPDRLALLVTPRSNQGDIPVVARNKMLIPKHMCVAQLRLVIQKQLKTADKLRVFMGGQLQESDYAPVSHLHQKYKDEQGFLVVEYDMAP